MRKGVYKRERSTNEVNEEPGACRADQCDRLRRGCALRGDSGDTRSAKTDSGAIAARATKGKEINNNAPTGSNASFFRFKGDGEQPDPHDSDKTKRRVPKSDPTNFPPMGVALEPRSRPL